MPSFKNGNFVSLTADAWSNVKNETVVNYMAVNPENSLFVEVVHTEEQDHDANWIAQDLERVMKLIQCDVSGAITDNMSTKKNAWTVLKEKCKCRFFHRCISHGYHLLVKDIFSTSQTACPRGYDNTASYPDDYPFENLLGFVLSCKDIVTFFHVHHGLKAKHIAAL